MVAYIVITTQFAKYKCHDYRMKNGRVYFNSRAVNQTTVATIIGKEGEMLYENTAVTPYNPRARTSKPTPKAAPLKDGKKAKKSSLPDVIQL